MKTRDDYLAYAVRLSGHMARLNERLHEALQAAAQAAPGLADGGLPSTADGLGIDNPAGRCTTSRPQAQAAGPVPWYKHGKGLQCLARDLAASAREASGLCRDGSASAMTVVDRAAVQLEELAGLVYVRDAERVRAEILELLPKLSLTKPARELARRIREIVDPGAVVRATTTGEPSGPQDSLTYAVERHCPACGEAIPQDVTLCPKCGVREGDPEQR